MFGKKKQEPEPGDDPAPEMPSQETRSSSFVPTIGQLGADLDKLKAQFSSFYEMQKASNERFSRINEQIGELRAMLIDRDRASQHMEAKASQAIDLVETIQPEKLMIEVRKSDAKVEALKASLESNEIVMNTIVTELKETRNKLAAFKGMEEVVKLNDEVKKELSQIKLVQSVVERHADKVDTVFAEMQKAFGEYMKLSDTLKTLDQSSKTLTSEMDNLKVNMKETSTKKEVAALTTRVDEFEKKVGAVVNLMNERFESLEKKTTAKIDAQLERGAKLLKGFDTLAQKVPDLNKYFNLLSAEAKKAAATNSGSENSGEGSDENGSSSKEEGEVPVEKIKQPGEGTDAIRAAGAKQGDKKGLMGLFGKKK
jgi:chromosome segregation ATPase